MILIERQKDKYKNSYVISLTLELTLRKALALRRALQAQGLPDIPTSCGALDHISIIRLSIPYQK